MQALIQPGGGLLAALANFLSGVAGSLFALRTFRLNNSWRILIVGTSATEERVGDLHTAALVESSSAPQRLSSSPAQHT